MKNAFIAYLYAIFAAFSRRLPQLEIFVRIPAAIATVVIGDGVGYLPAVKRERSLRNDTAQRWNSAIKYALSGTGCTAHQPFDKINNKPK